MATKTNLITAINGFLSAIVTTLKHRNSMLEVINELYPTTQNETHTTGIITTSNANFVYNLNFTKIGRLVHVTGTATNVSGSILGLDESVFDFKATEFYPNETINQAFSSGNYKFTISDKLYLSNSVGNGETIIFNFSYSTQD